MGIECQICGSVLLVKAEEHWECSIESNSGILILAGATSILESHFEVVCSKDPEHDTGYYYNPTVQRVIGSKSGSADR